MFHTTSPFLEFINPNREVHGGFHCNQGLESWCVKVMVELKGNFKCLSAKNTEATVAKEAIEV